jgi:hypothetical protein
MRTAIFFGLILVALAIQPEVLHKSERGHFTAILFLCMVIMDLIDFIKSLLKDS